MIEKNREIAMKGMNLVELKKKDHIKLEPWKDRHSSRSPNMNTIGGDIREARFSGQDFVRSDSEFSKSYHGIRNETSSSLKTMQDDIYGLKI